MKPTEYKYYQEGGLYIVRASCNGKTEEWATRHMPAIGELILIRTKLVALLSKD